VVKAMNNLEAKLENLITQNLETKIKLENLTTQNLGTNFKLEMLSTQNLETNVKLENLTTQNLETNVKLENLTTQNLGTNSKLEMLSTQNLVTSVKLENLSTQVNRAIGNLEKRLENLEQRTIKQNLETNSMLENLTSQNLETNFKLENLSTQVNEAVRNLETRVENLEQRTIKQNLETNSRLENLTSQINKNIRNLEARLEDLEQRTIIQNVETNLKLEKLIALVNKTSTPQQERISSLAPQLSSLAPQPTPPAAVPGSSCKEQYEKHNSSQSQVYTLTFGSQKIPVYCHMGNFGCGGGGWTMAMKIDGRKRTFHYNSHQWSNRNTFNLAGGKTGFDTLETKLPTYWHTPFSKICLGMKIGQQLKFFVLNEKANSLHSLIANGQYRPTSLGRNTWKTLIGSQASLQRNCNKEGFNAVGSSTRNSKARIGILGNNENDCATCESRVGFGTGGLPGDSITCGNVADNGDNGDKHIWAMGYILVQ